MAEKGKNMFLSPPINDTNLLSASRVFNTLFAIMAVREWTSSYKRYVDSTNVTDEVGMKTFYQVSRMF